MLKYQVQKTQFTKINNFCAQGLFIKFLCFVTNHMLKASEFKTF